LAAVGRPPSRRSGAINDPKGKRIGISLNRKQIPCLTVKNQTPKMAPAQNVVAVRASAL
jgi:hypothetical protein